MKGKPDRIAQDLLRLLMARSERKGPTLEEGTPALVILALWVSMTPVANNKCMQGVRHNAPTMCKGLQVGTPLGMLLLFCLAACGQSQVMISSV